MSDADDGHAAVDVVVAACQLKDRQADPVGAVGEVVEAAARAEQRGAAVVCFPEAFLCGYTRNRDIARQRSIVLDSPGFRSVCGQLATLRATVILGVIEAGESELYNTAVVISANRRVGVYRKRHLVEECFTPGRSLPVFDAGAIRFGIGICSDARHRDDAVELARKGAQVIFYPLNNMLPSETADRWRDEHVGILRQRARDAGVWVLSADVIGEHAGQRSYGCTRAIAPTGDTEQQVDEHTEGTVLARIPCGQPSRP